jgi:hypothetical protein
MTQPSEHIELNQDQAAIAKHKLRDVQMASGTLADLLNKGEQIPRDLAKHALSLSEYKIAELGKLLGVDTESEQKIEERHAEMRRLNMRVRELEAQIGASQSPAMTQMGLGVLSRYLNHWWDLEGFGHISDERFDRYGATIKFSCSLFGNFSLLDSDTPVSDKDRKQRWLQSLRDRGFEILKEEGDRALIDSENNRRVLLDLFAARIPSAIVVSFENHRGAGGVHYMMRSVEVRIRQLADITQLPEPPAEN